ncbi:MULTISPECIES: Fic family protein [Corynebacterium]|uniref:Fic family protein n=1 Tax=Corynebacterium TaxID=1716 RepID=UPI0016591828|nr:MULTISPECIES: Fic family protein [Corynebacterium]QNP92132.1 Fic family protein [Corynebacterium zhongnanshanii]
MFGASAPFDPRVPYNALPPLPPAGEIETRAVLKAVIRAQEALAELNTACRLIPNPSILTATIPLREAQASSEIENVFTTNDELFKAAWKVDNQPTPATKEALRYNDALYTATQDLEELPVSEKLAVRVCTVLQGSHAQVRSTPGTFIGSSSSEGPVYTPPEGKQVIEQHLSAWERYLYSKHDLHPVVLMALAHYQFEAIHPFYDGNGRTGRILNIALLMQQGALRLPVLYLSGEIVAQKSEYYRLLNAVTRDGAWEEWILFMVGCVENAARHALQLIDAITSVQHSMEDEVRGAGIAPAKELAELLVSNPYLRISDVVEAGLAQRQTAAKWLKQLADKGAVDSVQLGREKIFINPRILQALS